MKICGKQTEVSLKKRERVIYIDILNIIACISVVFLHSNGIVHQYTNTTEWAQSLIVEVVCYWAVPVFVMLTGATLLNYREKYDTKTFFKKRVSKVVIPTIIWSIGLVIWEYRIGHLRIDDWSILNLIKVTFNTAGDSIYYFLFIIIGIYLTMPLLSVLTKPEYRKTLWYAVVVMFLTQSVFALTNPETGYNGYLTILFDGYLLYVFLGYLLSTTKLTKWQRITIYILGILSCIFRYSITYVNSIRDDYLYRRFFGYIHFHAVFLAVAVFEAVKNINWDKIIKKDKIKKALSTIASCSFGVYLIHKIVMYYEVKILVIDERTLMWRTLGAIFSYLISLTIVYLLKKIPILKRTVP